MIDHATYHHKVDENKIDATSYQITLWANDMVWKFQQNSASGCDINAPVHKRSQTEEKKSVVSYE